MDEELGRGTVVQTDILADHHLNEVAGSILVEVKLFRVGLEPGTERAAEDHAFTVRQEHLRSAAGMTLVARQVAALVHEADVADSGTDIGQLPWLSAGLVVGARADRRQQ